MKKNLDTEFQESISLNISQKNQLNFLITEKKYPQAYQYAKKIVDTGNGCKKVASWLDKASSINRGSPYSFISNFVRFTTIQSGKDYGLEINNVKFQIASDNLAKEVIKSFIDEGKIKDIESIISQDLDIAVKQLGLELEGWAGTFGAFFPLKLGGLALDRKGRFYSLLYQDWQKRGINNYFTRKVKWAKIFINNIVGFSKAISLQLFAIILFPLFSKASRLKLLSKR